MHVDANDVNLCSCNYGYGEGNKIVHSCNPISLHFAIEMYRNSNWYFCVCINATFHIHLTYQDITQVDTATNCSPDRANVTARIKDDSHTVKTSSSIEEKKKKTRDPNKHYISGKSQSKCCSFSNWQSCPPSTAPSLNHSACNAITTCRLITFTQAFLCTFLWFVIHLFLCYPRMSSRLCRSFSAIICCVLKMFYVATNVMNLCVSLFCEH